MNKQMQRHSGAILAAACALPGVVVAETAPTEGLIGWKFLYYREARDWVGTLSPGAYDPTADPLQVFAPSAFALFPIGSRFSLEGSLVYDIVSGATPRGYPTVSNASKMEENRLAGDLKGTLYFRRAAVGLSYARSQENDYVSNALALDMRLASDDNNTTLALGLGHSRDQIDGSDEKNLATNALSQNKSKTVSDVLVGVTQVLSPADVLKFNLTYSRGRGFFNDPYKNDVRPNEKNAVATLLQWNRYFAGSDSTLRSGYRYYIDNYKVSAHTVSFDFAKPLGNNWSVTPGFRYYTQSAAEFFYEPVVTSSGSLEPPANYDSGPFKSQDTRLSSFGAITLGSKIALRWGKGNTADFRYDYYFQSGSLRLLEEGSRNIPDFRAHMVQFGYSRRF